MSVVYSSYLPDTFCGSFLPATDKINNPTECKLAITSGKDRIKNYIKDPGNIIIASF